MIKLTIKDKEFNIADEWSDVNFGQYIDILNIQNDTWQDLEKSIKMIAALGDKPAELEEALYELDIEDFQALSESMKWINTEFKAEADKAVKKDKFEIDGKQYVIKKNYNKLTLGEMVSVEEMLKNPNYNHQEIALGILLREVVDGKEKPFNEEDFFYVLNHLKYKINLVEVYNYITFFLSGDKTSTTNNSRGFSITKMK